ncbi:MAG: flagellar biosynthesis protein FliQ [Candidatus Latescibacteria bacterium]|nr:flagellar biosynthesis protein FliQ [Candidatus Latescibacterota bacterium]
MTPEYIITLSQETMLLVLYVSGPVLLITLVVGLLVSIFQAVTQIHEMTLTFIPKILAVAALMLLLLPWMMQQMVDFTVQLLSSIPSVIG